jgi:hypothetical protein
VRGFGLGRRSTGCNGCWGLSIHLRPEVNWRHASWLPAKGIVRSDRRCCKPCYPVEASPDGGGLVLDPDYGVEFPGTVSELSGGQRDDEIRSALASAGFAESQIQLYREILYSQQDNQAIDWNRPLSPRLFWMEWMTQGVVQVACCGVILFLIGTIRW